MTIAVQTAIGEIGSKATTELSKAYNAMINCGVAQFGLNGSGIFLLNSGNLDGIAPFESSFTLATSDYGIKNNKRFRRIYLEVEVLGDSTFTLTVTPNKGMAITKMVSVIGAGLKTISFTIKREGGQGNYHTIKIASYDQFKIHSVNGFAIFNNITT